MKLLDILTSPWMIEPAKLTEICEIYFAHIRGPKIDWKGIEASIGYYAKDKEREPYCVVDGVAVIPVKGTLQKGFSLFSFLFGGSSMHKIGEAVKAAADDFQVKSILLDIDSPGGTVDGTMELSELIYNARGKKPIVAFTDGTMTSAAYAIGSAADKVYISGDTTLVGSIGTVCTHIDQSKWDEMMGDKYTHITSGKYKTMASPHGPLSEEAYAYLQEQVDYTNNVFINTVARNRGVTPEKALSMSDGARIYIGKQAIDAGLVDGVSTFDQIISKMTAGSAGNMFIKSEETETMNEQEIKEKFPQAYQAIFDAGKTEGASGLGQQIEAGRAEGLAAGAEAERKRILEVRAQLIPGHEAIIEECINDGKTTGPEAAVKVLAAEKISRDAKAKQLLEEGNLGVDNTTTSGLQPKIEGETAKDWKEAQDKLDSLAKAKAAEAKISYSKAFEVICAENPELAKLYNLRS